MPRITFEQQKQHIKEEILLLGSMVEQAILDSVKALKNRDIAASQRIHKDDLIINEKRFSLENAILISMATQQPFARDLRELAAMLIVVNELERMGDYAKGIAKTNERLGLSDIPIPIRDFEKMAELGVSMLHRALKAFVDQDPKTAVKIPQEDDEVDALFNKTYHSIVNSMIANPSTIDQANLLMWVAHNLERMADRVTNICERTVFICSGELLEMDSSYDEDEELY